jgi:hypothetical protein
VNVKLLQLVPNLRKSDVMLCHRTLLRELIPRVLKRVACSYQSRKSGFESLAEGNRNARRLAGHHGHETNPSHDFHGSKNVQEYLKGEQERRRRSFGRLECLPREVVCQVRRGRLLHRHHQDFTPKKQVNR